MGLREAKKAKTRIHIANIARDLFLDRGYDEVTVVEIAAKAEVAVATLFNYYPTKESIIFDREHEIDDDLLKAIRERREGQSILEALHKCFAESELMNPKSKRELARFMNLVLSSAALTSYYRGMWDRSAEKLSKEIENEAGVGAAEAGCIARLVLESVSHACQSNQPKETLQFSFKILKNGWNK